MKKVLLLTNSYEFNTFIDERRAIKLLVKGKVEALSYWDDFFHTSSDKIKIPSIVRLLYSIKRVQYKSKNTFNRMAIIRRDKYTCQYCSKVLTHKEISIDHVIPRSYGGSNMFTNCVVSCKKCNSIKRNRTPEEANMKLINKPKHPTLPLLYVDYKHWHKEWFDYIK